MQSWQMQAAKARFSELVKHAAQQGPQDITVHGRSVAVVVSRELFDRLCGNEQSLVDFMRASPLRGHDEIEFERDRGLPREIDF
ncbi:MAG: type II toxin-antitoxin system Phd/YefM family antitoxin [Burkholderiaceae bacterium]|nr:type II toxin-antitoxin system Phd/YefM family antitoxin [Burkholderiaceae bacterium]